jgi:glycosyltransferase involved in cell wall biosynthesis
MNAHSGSRVFIGLPVFNGARFLANAIDSLLAQTFSDFTLLVSDNASTDETRQICEHYVSVDSRVRYVRQSTNAGAPCNWNFVARQAHGDYFKWATANDECAPEMLELCVRALDNDPTSVLCQGRTCLVDEESGRRREYENDLALLHTRPSERLKTMYLQLGLNNGQAGLIRLNVLRQTGLERKYRGGDYALMAELALRGRFIVLPELLLYRRMGPTTFSRHINDDQLGNYYGSAAAQGGFAERRRLHVDTMWAALSAPIGWSERAAATAFAFRRMWWDHARLWRDLRDTLASR